MSLCAGQGHDLLEVLAHHPRGGDVWARLVERDPRNAAVASASAADTSLDQVEVVVGDAALTDQYADIAPADIVLACGIFGNVSDFDIRNTIVHCAQLCRTGAIVIWTRHRRPPDLVPQICQWFGDAGFALRWLSDPGAGYGVGVHEYVSAVRRLTPGISMFTFASG